VFPWILADYESQSLNLDAEASFRSLDRPMGAQSDERAAEFRARFDDSGGGGVGSVVDGDIPPFHYGTHYSSAAVVLFFNIRLQPFTDTAFKFQGGRHDHPDRLFQSVGASWLSASQLSTSDVKELTPEFFCAPAFLRNGNDLDLGATQESTRRINHVRLPPWANGSAREFARLHRRALESDFVSQRVHSRWCECSCVVSFLFSFVLLLM
jgi:hypothetical protein